MDDELIPLAEAAKLVPGATKDTLLRQARAGRLAVYRVGKLYATTRADIDAMVKACRVVRKDVPVPNVAGDAMLATMRTLKSLEAARKTARELKARVRKKP